MRTPLTLRLALASIALWSALAWARSTGPDPSKTGAPSIAGRSAEVSCQSCHMSFMGPNLDVNGTLEILGVPDSYQPGETYALTVRLTTAQTAPQPGRRWGFQLTAVSLDTGDGAGEFVLADPDTLQIVAGTLPGFETRAYVQHGALGTRDSLASPVEWAFAWRAPMALAGDIGFYAAGNAANGDGGTVNGDWIYTARDTARLPKVAARPVSWGAVKARFR